MARDLYAYKDHWLKGPYTSEEILLKYREANNKYPPIWRKGEECWQNIEYFTEGKPSEDTQEIGQQNSLPNKLPPGDLLVEARRVTKRNKVLKKDFQKLFKKFTANENSQIKKEIQELINKNDSTESKIFGAYEVLGLIGSGGMGKTYKAKQISMDRIVAVKLLKKEYASDQKSINGFFNEAKAIASLNHSNIVQAYEANVVNGRHFLCMEYVDGESLKEKISREQFLSIEESLKIVQDISKALQHAHDNKLVHRDVTPGNILLGTNGDVKLADLGLAKKVETMIIKLENDSSIVGSPYFMSPEQIKNVPKIDIRSDIYSLGCNLFYMITGEVPFGGKNLAQVINGHLNTPTPDIKNLKSNVSDQLKSIIEKMMSKDRDNRYNTPQEVLKDLQAELLSLNPKEIQLIDTPVENLDSMTKKLESWLNGGDLTLTIAKEDIEYTHLIAQVLEKNLEKNQALDEFFGYVSTLFTELIANAFDHGCGPAGKVQLHMELTNAFFRIIVEDTGPGFNVLEELETIKKEAADRERRRGLFQILNITQDISFNEKGNKVKAVIFRKSNKSKIQTKKQDDITMIEVSGKGDSLLNLEFEDYVKEFHQENPERVCLMVRTPWVASLFVTHVTNLNKKLKDTGSPFCMFVENHSCYNIMNTLGITDSVKTYESINDAMAYLNFSSIDKRLSQKIEMINEKEANIEQTKTQESNDEKIVKSPKEDENSTQEVIRDKKEQDDSNESKIVRKIKDFFK